MIQGIQEGKWVVRGKTHADEDSESEFSGISVEMCAGQTAL